MLADASCGASFSCLLFLRNGLRFWKKPLFFSFKTGMSLDDDMFDPLNCLVGEGWPLAGSKLEREVAMDNSLCESSLLSGRVGLGFELRSDGAPRRQNWVMPS